MNLQDMSIRELKSHRREVQEDELWPANDSGDQEKISAVRQKLHEIDAVLSAQIEERFWAHQQRDTSKGF